MIDLVSLCTGRTNNQNLTEEVESLLEISIIIGLIVKVG
jgi:hypothetical protein